MESSTTQKSFWRPPLLANLVLPALKYAQQFIFCAEYLMYNEQKDIFIVQGSMLRKVTTIHFKNHSKYASLPLGLNNNAPHNTCEIKSTLILLQNFVAKVIIESRLNIIVVEAIHPYFTML